MPSAIPATDAEEHKTQAMPEKNIPQAHREKAAGRSALAALLFLRLHKVALCKNQQLAMPISFASC
jgi:hypothetical protein